MFSDEVDRISIKNDAKWGSYFIEWLEDLETQKVGAEDGVFLFVNQATVDPSLRVLQPQNEEEFVATLAQSHLSTVTFQTLKRFKVDGLYHLTGHKASESFHEEFKQEASKLHPYKTFNCCIQILQEENYLEKLFNHIDSDVICNQAVNVWGRAKNNNTSSTVLLEEAKIHLREMHEKFMRNIADFTWERNKNLPPKQCPEVECTLLSDSEDSLFSDEDAHETPEECQSPLRLKKPNVLHPFQIKEENSEYSTNIFYGHGLESCNKDLQITSNLNMSRIFNLLWLVPEFYPGFHSTYIYFGTGHSMFPVHVEDSLCWSLNYLHVGHPKLWVIIPPWSTDLLEFHLQKGGISLQHSSCRNLLGHKILIPTVNWLKQRRIPFKIVVQRQGDMVVLRPNSAHFGYNLGHNIAQAVNIATKSWIPWGLNAKKCSCMQKQIHLNMLPLVSAFREDLLPTVLNGGVVMTPEILRGMHFLYEELNHSYGFKNQQANKTKQLEKPVERNFKKTRKDKKQANGADKPSEGETIQCPATNCTVVVPKIPLIECRAKLKRHINSAHKPIIKQCKLQEKIDELFQ